MPLLRGFPKKNPFGLHLFFLLTTFIPLESIKRELGLNLIK